MSHGWVKLHRRMAEHPCFKDPAWVSVWVYLLIHAAHKPHRAMFNGKIITLKPGQLVTGRRVISAATGVHESKVFRTLKLLELEQQIEQQTSNRSSLISITNWCQYQDTEQQANNGFGDSGQQGVCKSEQQMDSRRSEPSDTYADDRAKGEQQMNNQRTTDEQPVNTLQEGKECKKSKSHSSKPSVSEEGQLFAKWFRLLLKETGDDQTITTDQLKLWGTTYDALIRIDKRTKDQVKRVCTWARNDDFWREQFQSAAKLRRKDKDGVKYFDKFLTKLGADQPATLTDSIYARPPAPDDWRKRLDWLLANALPDIRPELRADLETVQAWHSVAPHFQDIIRETQIPA